MKAVALTCCTLVTITVGLAGCAAPAGSAKDRTLIAYTTPTLTLQGVNTYAKEHLTALHIKCSYKDTTGNNSFTYWIMYDQSAVPTAAWTGTDWMGADDLQSCQGVLADFPLYDGCAYIKIDPNQRAVKAPYLWPFIYTKRIVVTASGTEFIVQNISDDDHLTQRVIKVKIDPGWPVYVTSCKGGSVPITDQDTYAEDVLDNAGNETLKCYKTALTGDALTLYNHVNAWKDLMCPNP